MQTALITGISGQDGAYLARFLLAKGYRVVGAQGYSRGRSTGRLKALGILPHIEFVDLDLSDDASIRAAFERLKPDEIYNLAAESLVGASFDRPVQTIDVNGLAVARLLETLRRTQGGARFYQASTSEMFGRAAASPQNEATPFHPESPYSVAKLCAHWLVGSFRESFGTFACSGILFHHESPLRSQAFVTRKITLAMARIKLGQQEVLELGNLDARRDWGFAGDYVEAMWAMLQAEKAADYVVATGTAHSVRDFATLAAEEAGIAVAWEGTGISEVGRDARSGDVIVRIDPAFLRTGDPQEVRGDAERARRELGWVPGHDLKSLVGMMVAADLERVAAGAKAF